MSENASEIELMRRIGDGDSHAYRLLSERHLHAIHRYAARLLRDTTEAEDVTQETFLRMWTHAASFQPDAKVSTWLHQIAHNLCVDRLRRSNTRNEQAPTRNRDSEHPTPLEQATAADRPSDLLMRKQAAISVEHALAALPERQRAAIVLVHYQGMSNPEAASVIGVGVEAVESLLSRARRTLRETLASLNDGKDTRA